MKKNLIISLFIMGAFVLSISCSNSKKSDSAIENATEKVEGAETEKPSTESVDEISLSDAFINFANDDLSKALKQIISFDIDDYPLQINGNEMTLTLRVRGNNKDSFDAAVVERLAKAKIEMALFDDNGTEIGNQRLELNGISFADLYKWIVTNDIFDNKEVTFACKNFTAVSKLKNLDRAKIYAEE